MSELQRSINMETTTNLMRNAIIQGHPSGTLIDIFESDRVLYKSCEFREVTIIFRDGVNSSALRDCLIRDCEIIAPEGTSKSQALLGYNVMLGGTYNGEEVEDFRTNGK